jgi:hypothetical protein
VKSDRTFTFYAKLFLVRRASSAGRLACLKGWVAMKAGKGISFAHGDNAKQAWFTDVQGNAYTCGRGLLD